MSFELGAQQYQHLRLSQPVHHLPSAPMSLDHQSPHDLGDGLPCESLEPGAQQLLRLRLSQLVLLTRYLYMVRTKHLDPCL